jgi:hypothetical protein
MVERQHDGGRGGERAVLFNVGNVGVVFGEGLLEHHEIYASDI